MPSAPTVHSTNTTTSGTAPKPRGRVIELDILRGFLLLWMTFTHLPTAANLISNQTFGFVSGAEGFIFLAGFMIGQLEHHIELKKGQAATVRDAMKRTLRVYLFHCALLVIAFTLVAAIGVTFHRQGLQNLLSFYLKDPKHAVIAAFLLLYRPSLLDILPMYVLFLMLTPVAREVARRWTWDPVIYASLSFWVVAQFGFRTWVYKHVNLFGLSVPQDSTGSFDVYAWQLLWMAGLALGSINAERVEPSGEGVEAPSELGLPPWLLRFSVAMATCFLILRYCPVDHWVDPHIYGWLVDKWHLGAARVLNFSALAIVLVRFGAYIANLPFVRPLALLGQASIEVFSVHVLFCLGGHALSRDADPNLPWYEQALLLIATVSALFATALAAKRYNRRKKALILRPATA